MANKTKSDSTVSPEEKAKDVNKEPKKEDEKATLESIKKENDMLKEMMAELMSELKKGNEPKVEVDEAPIKSPQNSKGGRSPEYWNELVEYTAFYDGGKYKDDVSVKVNGKRFLIKRGVPVMIPRYVKEVLDNSEKQKAESASYARSLEEQFEAETRALEGRK